jgi:hypothetical protein
MLWGQIVVKAMELVSFFLGLWGKNEQKKEEWQRLIEQARQKYNRQGSSESSQIKKDYDELQQEIKDGKWKV